MTTEKTTATQLLQNLTSQAMQDLLTIAQRLPTATEGELPYLVASFEAMHAAVAKAQRHFSPTANVVRLSFRGQR